MYSILAFLIVGTLWTVNCEIHSLTYIYTAFSKPVNLPGIHEFTAMGLLDDRMIDYYDSSIKKKVPKQPWMEERLEKDYWDKGTQSRQSKEQWFKVNLGILRDRMRHVNDTGLHILQWRHGCTAEKQAGDDQSIKFISGRDEYSYDGNDFLSFDDDNKRWIAPVDLAVPTKRKWDEVKMLNDYTQGYLERECVNWLSKFVDYGQQQLKQSRPPELHVYSKNHRNPAFLTLYCMATGFLPKEVTLNIRRDGKVVDRLDGLQTTGVRPNGDGTFQIMNRVEILRSDSAKFTCQVIHPASDMDKTVEWDHSCPPVPGPIGPGAIAGIGIGVVAVVALLVGVLVGLLCFSKKKGPQVKGSVEEGVPLEGKGSKGDIGKITPLTVSKESGIHFGNGSIDSLTDSGRKVETSDADSDSKDSLPDSGQGSRSGGSSPESVSLLGENGQSNVNDHGMPNDPRVVAPRSGDRPHHHRGSREDSIGGREDEMKNLNGQDSRSVGSSPESDSLLGGRLPNTVIKAKTSK